MFRKKETYTIKEFMNRGKAVELEDSCAEPPLTNWEIRKAKEMGLITGFTLPVILAPLVKGSKALAASTYPDGAVEVVGKVDMYHKMIVAFDPLIGLVQALAYPVCMVVVLGGALFIMIGNKEKGFAMMQGAGLGYVLVQMTPIILNILVDAMKAVV
ncbi:hypothetical protein [Bacillus sp. AFS017336]|uniref:hypothetical protein n=1 Tax=Bacillus sp. AFS017336 TaxID=2033489 RepID=UPI000BF16EAC|nr:hypothetical protein [Bacillus sp. AFS017336]PEL13804.1 hypothetical protein CN601_03575 [Bacillus sp. AFS017336]